MNLEPINPLQRLQESLGRNGANELIPPESPNITVREAAYLFCAALDKSVSLRVITEIEHEQLRFDALQFDTRKLVQAETFVVILNGLVQGIDMRPHQAKDLIKLVCSANRDSAGAAMEQLLADLVTVDLRLEELFSNAMISEEEFSRLCGVAIGYDRVLAVQKIESDVAKRATDVW